jgi:hypothetical protein
MKFSTCPSPEIRNNQINFINQRWKQLYDLEKEWSDNAIKYLFLTNSGGAVAVLSYMGSAGTLFRLSMAIALCSFLLGLIIVGWVNSLIYQDMKNLFNEWKTDTNKYFTDQIEWETLLKNDENRSKDNVWAIRCAYISFICFIAGVVIGLISFFTK